MKQNLDTGICWKMSKKTFTKVSYAFLCQVHNGNDYDNETIPKPKFSVEIILYPTLKFCEAPF